MNSKNGMKAGDAAVVNELFRVKLSSIYLFAWHVVAWFGATYLCVKKAWRGVMQSCVKLHLICHT